MTAPKRRRTTGEPVVADPSNSTFASRARARADAPSEPRRSLTTRPGDAEPLFIDNRERGDRVRVLKP